MNDLERLFDWPRRMHSQDLLSDEIARLLDSAGFLLTVVADKGVRPGGRLEFATESGQTFGIPRDDVEVTERLLWRTGRIDDKAYVPR